MSYCEQLKGFLRQAETKSQAVKHFARDYSGLNVRVSFGQGNPAKVPWIAFLDDRNTVRNGIYPVFLYYKAKKLLVLAYGASEHSSNNTWRVKEPLTVREYFLKNSLGEPTKYGNCFYFRNYSVEDINCIELDLDLNEIIQAYRNQIG